MSAGATREKTSNLFKPPMLYRNYLLSIHHTTTIGEGRVMWEQLSFLG